jgi:hypothetical protein
MKKLLVLSLVTIFGFGFSGVSVAQEITVVVKGSSWDADSRGFASIGGLSAKQRTQTAARRGSRVSIDEHPELFAITGKGGEFELIFKTNQPTFRLIVEGDRFPRTITQPFVTPKESGELDVGRVTSPRAEGPEHTWPLPMVATALGYASAHEMLADNKAAIRFGIEGSGSEGAPDYTSGAKVTFPSSGGGISSVESTTTSPFLMRVQKPEYLFPIWMNPKDTYFQTEEAATGGYIIIVSFKPGDPMDKDVVIQIEDSVTNELLDPPRPWKFSPLTLKVRNGFATEYWTWPDTEGIE